MRGSLLVLALAGLVLLVGPRVAQADDTDALGIELVVVGGSSLPECLREGSLRDAVVGRLGYDPFVGPPRRRFVVELRRSEAARLEARINDELGSERVITSASGDCRELAGATALALAIAIDPLAPASDGVPTPTAPSSASSNEPPPPPTATPIPSLSFEVGGGAIAAMGTAPEPTVGLLAEGAVRYGDLSILLSGRADWPRARRVGTGDVTASILAAALAGCGHRGALAFCGLVSAGVVRAEGHDLEDARLVMPPFAAVGARVHFDVPITATVSVRPLAVGRVTVVSATLQVSNRDVWRTPLFTGDVGLALVVHDL